MCEKLIESLKQASGSKSPYSEVMAKAAEVLSLNSLERSVLQKRIASLHGAIQDDRTLLTKMEEVLADAREALKGTARSDLISRADDCLRHYDASLGVKFDQAGNRI
ncbi:TPA: hypothetical protein ACPWO2_006389 [Pseudomonas aeruginosa]|uniref:hypothetical protein n=1 Tax=Pseudomonas aeruginosa group TaxID=136841 RepID=UPI001D0AA368|nr:MULTISPECIES: hypothetical protein [Pseudomonas aeruginosa group]ELQ8316865.1 hypothetical protein [Pseudomonas aeruginosa]MCC0246421.1 hypothetical protein [Pseudomonas aeruginosa]MDG9858397.1 hypothetical protein [Pseudomonas nitroreducens]MDH1077220.1 hypothetical protein [Pseudomonas nitroreducens]HEJ3670528.1 hypothetical protein [Pseudomonas aeruginosa]